MTECKSDHQTFGNHNYALIASLVALSLLLTGCGEKPTPSPKSGAEAALTAYLDAALDLRHEDAYQLLSTQDRQFKSLENYQEVLTFRVGGYLPGRSSAETTYVIHSITENDLRAKADVSVTGPDYEAMAGALMSSLFTSALEGDSEEELSKQAEAELQKINDVPAITKRSTFTLVKESAGWKVLLFEEEILAEAEKQAYIEQVELYELSAKYHEFWDGSRDPIVNFKLKNNGDRTLNRVDVTVYFSDERGTIIHEEVGSPVLQGGYSRGAKPLRPNYIWEQGGRDYWRSFEDVPSEWSEGAVTAKVTSIEFE